MLNKFSDWFDNLNEPKRFFVLLVLVFGWWIPLLVLSMLDSNGIHGGFFVNLLIISIASIITYFYTLMLYRLFYRK